MDREDDVFGLVSADPQRWVQPVDSQTEEVLEERVALVERHRSFQAVQLPAGVVFGWKRQL